MKKNLLLLLLIVLAIGQVNAAKKYKYTFNPPFEVEEVMIAKRGTNFVKSWAVDKNADKAIIKAKQNAILAVLFTGIRGNQVKGTNGIRPICSEGQVVYEQHKEYFDNFMISGEFLEYIKDINSTYPTGPDNIETPNGRRVGVNLQIFNKLLRERLEKDGIITELGKQLNL